jgi:2-polyprenyl-6-methoxyphenol hydroxylase-like FAD-dependent oxidoreductase
MQLNHGITQHNSKPLRVLIAGGSMGGLCAGLALRGIGCDVEIFERASYNEANLTPSAVQSRGAGLVVQMEINRFLAEHGITTAEALGVTSWKRQYIVGDGSIIWEESTPQLMTSWDMLYRQLRNLFPDQHYHQESKVIGVEQSDDCVVVCFEDGRKEKCDLLIGADGADSTIRQQLLPDAVPQYAGYVAWRGLIDESLLSSDVAKFFAEQFTLFHGPSMQALCYLVPGPNGELDVGKRRINWLWYFNVVDGDELKTVMTDSQGRVRKFFLPQGEVRESVIQQMRVAAKGYLPEIFQYLFELTEKPFIQPIYDLSVPRMVFGRVCLIGDAAFVVRPHTAAGTSKAAINAIELAQELQESGGDVVAALEKWEPIQLAMGNYLKVLGVTLGNRSGLGHYVLPRVGSRV